MAVLGSRGLRTVDGGPYPLKMIWTNYFTDEYSKFRIFILL